jgi:hypothetical protein
VLAVCRRSARCSAEDQLLPRSCEVLYPTSRVLSPSWPAVLLLPRVPLHLVRPLPRELPLTCADTLPPREIATTESSATSLTAAYPRQAQQVTSRRDVALRFTECLSEKPPPPSYPKKLCRNIALHGYCKFAGKGCEFSHDQVGSVCCFETVENADRCLPVRVPRGGRRSQA